MNKVIVRDADYGDMLWRQRELFAAMVEKKRSGSSPEALETLFLVEHRPVYTLGKHGNKANILNRAAIAATGAGLYEIERGGDITFHGPGQLVAYPLMDFGRRGMGVKDYVNLLEEAVIRTIARYGLEGGRVEGATGVWLRADNFKPERKICAIGVKCSRFIAMHGLALNVSTDLSWFAAINPCGFTDKGVTSISEELGRDVPWDEVSSIFSEEFMKLM